MPKLLQVAWSAQAGGLERVVQQLADEAVARGWQSLVAFCRKDPPERSNARYIRLQERRYGPWAMRLMKLIRSESPQVVHLHGPLPGSTGAIAARLAGVRSAIYTDHFVHSLRPKRYQVARRLASRIPDINVGVSQAVARSLVEDAHVPPERVIVIRNGTPIVEPLPPPREGPKTLFYVANFSPWKNHLMLIDAVAGVDPKLDFKVVMIGRGPHLGAAREAIDRRGLRDRIVLAGFVDEPWTLAAGGWGYLHPSVGEGLPLSLLEAMMRGLPAIATATAGIPEVIEHLETGLLVDRNEPSHFAAAITKLLEDRSLRDRLSVSARNYAQRELAIENTFESYFSLYESTMRRHALAGGSRP